MSRGRIEVVLWLAAVIGVAFGAREVRRPDDAPMGTRHLAATTTWTTIPARAHDRPSDGPNILVERNPFRFSRTASAMRYGMPAPTAIETTHTAPRLPRPTFALLGTAGGPPWQGIVRGFPGRTGSVVVVPQQRVDSFVVVTVGRDTVVLKTQDTIWVLVARRGSL